MIPGSYNEQNPEREKFTVQNDLVSSTNKWQCGGGKGMVDL